LGGFPFNGVEVEIVGEGLTGGERNGFSGIGGRSGEGGAVEGAVVDGGFAADVLHDVDFAALGPADAVNIFAEEPEGGPDSLPFGDLDAGLEAAIGLSEAGLGFEAGGGVGARDAIGTGEVFLASGDHQVAAPDLGVARACGVGFEFLIAPAVAAEVVGPFGGIGGGTIGEGEFVGPRELPGRRSRKWRVTSGERGEGTGEGERRGNEAGSNDYRQSAHL